MILPDNCGSDINVGCLRAPFAAYNLAYTYYLEIQIEA